MYEWFGFFMPGAAPPEIAARISQAIQAVADAPRIQRALDELAVQVSATSPAGMGRRIAAERHHWQDAIAKMGLRLE